MELSADNVKIRVTIRCPYCNQRLLDKVTPVNGFIKMKCPRCKTLATLNLSLRCVGIKYRTTKVA